MSKLDKILDRMRKNPQDWKLSDLEVVAKRCNVMVRRGKGSHVSFSHPNLTMIITIPAHRPIKSVYIKKFVSFIDALQED